MAASLIAVALGLIFLAVGLAKLLHARPLVADFARFGYPGWFCPATGGVEVTGAALLLAGIAAGRGVALAGAALLVVVMVGALATHLRTGDPAAKIGPSLVLLVALGAEITLRAAAGG